MLNTQSDLGSDADGLLRGRRRQGRRPGLEVGQQLGPLVPERRAIASYVALQAEHSAALRDQWAELLPDLDAGAPLPPPPAEEAVGV